MVSPVNARERLAIFLRGARKQLLVYDPKLTDPMMIRILHERRAAGVSVRILGNLGKRGAGLTAEKFPGKRLHVRAIVRDGQQAFVGSQGLRKLELDGRREVGVIVRDPKVVARMAAIFESGLGPDRSGQTGRGRRQEGREDRRQDRSGRGGGGQGRRQSQDRGEGRSQRGGEAGGQGRGEG